MSSNISDKNINVLIVDENDRIIAEAEKLSAHRQGLLHRAFSIFIFNQKLELLLQQRSHNKYHCPGIWANTCCSHAVKDESIVDTAKKRLQFEMGFSLDLEYAGVFKYYAELDHGMKEHEIDHVFIAIENQITVQPNPDEVAQYKWLSLDALSQELATNSTKYSPWLPEALAIATQKLYKNHTAKPSEKQS